MNGSGPFDDDELAHLVALTGMPGIGPIRLDALLQGRSPSAAWAAFERGVAHEWPGVADAFSGVTRDSFQQLLREWRRRCRSVDPVAELARHRAAGVHVLTADSPELPAKMQGHPETPPIVYIRGNPALTDRPTVGIVGTRRATNLGKAIATEFGEALAGAGVCVLSGLAFGIDGAAHRGALAAADLDDPGARARVAPPAAVVAGGLDQVSPVGNATLWETVAATGMMLAEAPLGVEPARWRFAARNRLVAQLSDVLVVVETGLNGGSWYTIDAANDLGVPMLAVPGSLKTAASAGTNRLIRDGGATICLDVDDIFDCLAERRPDAPRVGAAQLSFEGPDDEGDEGKQQLPSDLSADARRVLDLLDRPCWIDDLVVHTEFHPGRVVAAVRDLELRHLVVAERGQWKRRPVMSPARSRDQRSGGPQEAAS